MSMRSLRGRKIDAQLISAVAVLTRELENMLVRYCGYTHDQARASVVALIDLPGLPEKLKQAA